MNPGRRPPSAAGTRDGAGPRTRRTAPAALHVAIAFVAGASVMVVELAGIRLLAPLFGSSLYTWTALIGVVLVAFSLGGYLGGRLADRTADVRALAALLLVAALATVLVPPLYGLVLREVDGLGLIAGPTVLSLLLFTVPGCALGAVSPFVTRLLALDGGDRRIGRAAGVASAAGTVGSFVGTFATGFLLVPTFGTRAIFLGVALAVGLCALLLLVVARVRPATDDLAMGVFVGSIAVGLWWLGDVRHSDRLVELRESRHQQIGVFDDPDETGRTVRRLFHDTVQQGALILETDEVGLPYQRYWRLAGAYLDEVDRALVIGGGTFGMPRALASAWPEARITTVELDPDVVRIAGKHFRFTPTPRNRVEVTDARWFLARDDTRYDLIVGDAYNGVRSIPPHLATREFFQTIDRRLADGGIYLMNVIGAQQGPRAAVYQAIRRTLASVFDEIHVYAAYGHPPERIDNLLIVAGRGTGPPAAGDDGALAVLLETRVRPAPIPRSAPILTDDFNPVEYLIARTLAADPS